MRRGISSKVVDGWNGQRVGILEDWNFIDAALVWFQNGESVGLAPPKAIFQQIVLFREVSRGEEAREGTNPLCPISS